MKFLDAHGSGLPLPEQTTLAAGPFTLTFEHGDLRWIRLGHREVVRRVYGAVRDRQWNTVPMTIDGLTMDARADGFTIGYTATHRARSRAGGEADVPAGEAARAITGQDVETGEAIEFVWRAGITGEADGTIIFTFDGEARTSFLRNRIGLCLLHPLAECIGAHVRLRRGGERDAWIDGPSFPDLVAREQPIAGFTGLTGLAHEIEPGVWAEYTFEGERFETEDQRNWIDASFKTYGTPLSLPVPVEVAAGTRVFQRITLRLTTGSVARVTAKASPITAQDVVLTISRAERRALPALGVCLSTPDGRLGAGEIDRLRAMRLAHLRVDVRPGDSGVAGAGDGAMWQARLTAALDTIRQVGCRVELAIHLRAIDAGITLPLLFSLLTPSAIARLIVFDAEHRTTTRGVLDAVRAHVRSRGSAWRDVPIASGSTRDLYQFHLDDPPVADAICWSIHPQAHAADISSIAETPVAVADQVRSVKTRHPGVGVVISPVMFSPSDADPRQRSSFAAAWTLAVLKRLIESGADSATFFDATGPRGVMDDRGVFPPYDVLKDSAAAAEESFASGPGMTAAPYALVTGSSDEAIASLLLCGSSSSALLVANLSRRRRRISLPVEFRVHDAALIVPPFTVVRVDGASIRSL